MGLINVKIMVCLFISAKNEGKLDSYGLFMHDAFCIASIALYYAEN